MLIFWLSVLVGVVVLYLGGEILVRSSTSLAAALGVKPLVIGLTIVAFGTSAPELATGVIAAAHGAPGIAIGNVIGSNVANVGLILGLTALLGGTLLAERAFVRREVVFMIGVSLLLIPFLLSGGFVRWHAFVLLVLMAGFIWMMMRSDGVPEEELDSWRPTEHKVRATLGVLLGLVLLTGGARLLVWGAQELARTLGVPEPVIGLTVVAFGTSVPELASCLVAAAKKEAGLVLGNIVGSNIFNILLILAAAVLVHPLRASWSEYGVDLLVMVAFSLVLLLFLSTSDRLTRREGVVLLSGYLVYIGYLAIARA